MCFLLLQDTRRGHGVDGRAAAALAHQVRLQEVRIRPRAIRAEPESGQFNWFILITVYLRYMNNVKFTSFRVASQSCS